jgi:restriction system protein
VHAVRLLRFASTVIAFESLADPLGSEMRPAGTPPALAADWGGLLMSIVMDRPEIPTYRKLVLPVLRAVKSAAGSAQREEIKALVGETFPDDLVEVTYQNRPMQSVLLDRVGWGISCAKLIGALDSPRRGFFIITSLGERLLAAGEADSESEVRELDISYRAAYRASKKQQPGKAGDLEDVPVDEDVVDEGWREVLLARLHSLSPEGFERFVIALMKTFHMTLEHVGGSGDEGIDGIGLAPLSPVLSTRVAIQAKRYDPEKATVSRDAVALFQRDAATKGAERAIMVTLGRFTKPARDAAVATTPTVELIDGRRLCDLVQAQEFGIQVQPVVSPEWFDRFESQT